MRMVHHEKQTTWHGSVTVFFSLTGVLILCLLLAVVEAVRIQGAKAQTASLEGVANFSVLAEYEKNLLEEFEIFALDGAGGSGSFQIQKSEIHFEIFNMFDPAKQINKDSSSGIGLNIIRRRLDILYRRRYDLQINQKNGYFDVSLTIKLT